jgi:hypothetical protein
MKPFLSAIAFLSLIACTSPEPAKPVQVTGVITYFFNKAQGDKPDLGATVWVVDSSKATDYNHRMTDTFNRASFTKHMISNYRSIDKDAPLDIVADAQTYGGDDSAKFNTLDERQYHNIKTLTGASVVKTTVDANGKYSVDVMPGTYYVLIKSKNRDDISLTEIGGKIYCKKVRIERNSAPVDVSHNFDLY